MVALILATVLLWIGGAFLGKFHIDPDHVCITLHCLVVVYEGAVLLSMLHL